MVLNAPCKVPTVTFSNVVYIPELIFCWLDCPDWATWCFCTVKLLETFVTVELWNFGTLCMLSFPCFIPLSLPFPAWLVGVMVLALHAETTSHRLSSLHAVTSRQWHPVRRQWYVRTHSMVSGAASMAPRVKYPSVFVYFMYEP
jgi:hypothetical protein